MIRCAAGVGFALALISILGRPAAAADTLRVAKATGNAFAFVPLDVGQRVGIFAKHGLAIDGKVEFTGGARLHQALAAGSVDIGLGSGVDLAFVAKGSPVKGVAALAGPPLEMVIAVKADGPVKTEDDLKGRLIGVSSPTALTGWLVGELGRRHGWGPNGIDRSFSGSVPARWAALKLGEIEGTAVDIGTALQAQRNGLARVVTSFGEKVKDFHVHVIFATNDLIKNKPEQLRSFLAAWFESVAWMRAHKAETVEIAADVLHVDRDIAEHVYDRATSEFSDDGRFDPAALETLKRSFVELHILDHEPDLRPLYTEAFLPGAKPGN
jgi:ABC-type nitrate/sulfonate/bicarbonate transport system substrate-binding protein